MVDKFAIKQTLGIVGFTTSVRALGATMLSRDPTQQPQQAATGPVKSRFRGMVARAMGYLREDRKKSGV